MLRHSTLQGAARTALRSSTRQRVQANAARTFFTIVQQGHEAWRLSLGRDPVKLEPGLSLMIPWYHSVQDVDMREKSVRAVPRVFRSAELTYHRSRSKTSQVLRATTSLFSSRDPFSSVFATHTMRASRLTTSRSTSPISGLPLYVLLSDTSRHVVLAYDRHSHTRTYQSPFLVRRSHRR